ncbi:MAG: hypothetical protein HY536_00745 [Candidatus Colwellbacteria bacterium]|nr:hypothetical protein [Candidatus Colwellbacteria bacterium]
MGTFIGAYALEEAALHIFQGNKEEAFRLLKKFTTPAERRAFVKSFQAEAERLREQAGWLRKIAAEIERLGGE